MSKLDRHMSILDTCIPYLTHVCTNSIVKKCETGHMYVQLGHTYVQTQYSKTVKTNLLYDKMTLGTSSLYRNKILGIKIFSNFSQNAP